MNIFDFFEIFDTFYKFFSLEYEKISLEYEKIEPESYDLVYQDIFNHIAKGNEMRSDDYCRLFQDTYDKMYRTVRVDLKNNAAALPDTIEYTNLKHYYNYNNYSEIQQFIRNYSLQSSAITNSYDYNYFYSKDMINEPLVLSFADGSNTLNNHAEIVSGKSDSQGSASSFYNIFITNNDISKTGITQHDRSEANLLRQIRNNTYNNNSKILNNFINEEVIHKNDSKEMENRLMDMWNSSFQRELELSCEGVYK